MAASHCTAAMTPPVVTTPIQQLPLSTVVVLVVYVMLFLPSTMDAGSFSDCFTNESHTKACFVRYFSSDAVGCIGLPTANASLSVNASCFASSGGPSSLDDALCHRTSWKAFAACLADVSFSSSATDACVPFASEATCQANLGLLAACNGSLSGICSIMGFPKRNCTTMAASVAAAAMCPIANAAVLCANCTNGAASLSLTDQVLVAAANDGLRQGNVHNTVLVYPNVSAYGSDVAALVLDLATFAASNEVSFFIVGNEMAHFDSVVDAFSAVDDKFFLVVLRIPLVRSLSEYPRVMFLSGRLDLLTYVAGYTLAVASKSRSILFSSHDPKTTFERSFFMGFVLGAETAAPNNISVIWGTTLQESMAAWRLLGVDGFSSGSAPQLIFPFLTNATGVGIFGDYLSDPATFRNLNTTESQHLLFSVTGNLDSVVTPQLRAAAVGSFNTGLVSGDADVVDVQPCVYSCGLLTPTVLGAMRRSFGLVHRQGWQGAIDYTTAEKIYSGTAIDADAPLLPTGAPVVYAALPTLAALDHDRVVVLSLDEVVLANRVALFSLGVGHFQPMLLAQATADAPSQRTGYAVAHDPQTKQVFVSMGLASTTLTLLSDVWSLRVTQRFQLTPSWTRRSTTVSLGGAAPSPRHGHKAVVSDGVLMLYGGSTFYNPASSLRDLSDGTLYRLNTTTNEWLPPGASTSSGRTGHGMVVHRFDAPRTIYDTTCVTWVIVAGGATSPAADAADESVVDALLMYCPAADVWHRVQLRTATPVGDGSTFLVRQRASFCMVVLPARLGGALAIMGGDDATLPDVLVDVESGTFTMDVDVLNPVFRTNTTSIGCVAVANSAMQLARDWAVVCMSNGSSLARLRYYWPPAVACTPYGASIPSFSKLTCRTCPDNYYADAMGEACVACQEQSDNARCGERISKVLVGVTVSLSGVFLVVALPLSFQGIRSFRSLRRKAQSERIGVELAESISSLEFERLHFLSTLKHPTRLQRAFLTILHILVTYMQFMPMWVLAGDRVKADRREDDGDGGDGRESHTDTDDEDEALPHRLPRGKPPRSSSPQLPNADGGSRSMIYRSGGNNISVPTNDDAVSTSSGQTTSLAGRNLEERLNRFQHRLLEGMVTVVHIKFPDMDVAFGVRAMSRGQLTMKPDVKALSDFYLGVTGCIDRFGGLIEAQWNHRLTVTFNGLRCHNDPELQSIRCALALSAMAEHVVHAGSPPVPRAHRDTIAALGRTSVVCCGIAAGFAHVGVVGKRFGKHATIVGSTYQEAMSFCSAAETCGQNIVLPFLKMKHSVGGKIALRIIGENKTYGNESSSSQTTASMRGSCERHILACVLGRRRDVGAVQLQSVDCFNTAMDYIFNGAISAAEGLLSSHRKSQLLDGDRLMVREALHNGSIPVLDCSGLVDTRRQ